MSTQTGTSTWRQYRPYVLRVSAGLLAIIAWEVFTRIGGSFATPPVTEIVRATLWLPTQADFWAALGTTLESLVVGYPIAVVVGVAVGFVAGTVRLLERVTLVYLTVMLSIPLSAVVPVVVIFFGIGITARVAVVVLFAIPMIAMNTLTGVSTVPKNLIEMGRSYGCSRRLLARKVILPAAMPGILSGLRLGAGRAVIGMIVAELIIIAVGIGRLMDRYSGRFDMGEVYGLVIFILVISAAFVNLVGLFEKRMLRWRDA